MSDPFTPLERDLSQVCAETLNAAAAKDYRRLIRDHVQDHASLFRRVEAEQYLGASTRYDVALEGGGTLFVVRQNAGGAAGDGRPELGAPVILAFARAAIQPMTQGAV